MSEAITKALTDPENQPNQFGVEFLMRGDKFAFKISNQQFTLDYEPTEPGEFEFMRDMLASAFSTFTPDVKTGAALSQARQGDDEQDAKWRDIALRFDKHRMQALWHLQAMLQDPAKHTDTVRQFLKDPSHPDVQAGQGGQGEVVAWEVTQMGREPEVMSQAEFTRRSFDTGKFRPLVYGDAAQPAPVPAPVPDGVWEALQRLIENGGSLGPASREDAEIVATYRDRVRFMAPKATVPATVASGAPMTDEVRRSYECLLAMNTPNGFKDRIGPFVQWLQDNSIAQQTAPAVPAGWRDALVEIFKDAMDWGRSYGQRINLSDITVADVSEGYADKALRSLLSAAPKPDHGEGK